MGNSGLLTTEDMAVIVVNEWLEKKKRSLVAALQVDADEHGWTQKHVMEATGLHQSEVSELLNGKLRRFSLERLLSVMLDLGYDITIRIEQR